MDGEDDPGIAGLRSTILDLIPQKDGVPAHNFPWLSVASSSPTEGFWGPPPRDKRSANKFLLGASIDFQMPWEKAWANASRVAEVVLGDPENLWRAILDVPEDEWLAPEGKYRLHRFAWIQKRVRRLGREIESRYDGDAQLIWRDRDSEEVLCRLERISFGPQLSRMVVLALLDLGLIQGAGNVKADLHVTRVLGRAVHGETITPEQANQAASVLMPHDTWKLDCPLWRIGQRFCKARAPKCAERPLVSHCKFARRRAISD